MLLRVFSARHRLLLLMEEQFFEGFFIQYGFYIIQRDRKAFEQTDFLEPFQVFFRIIPAAIYIVGKEVNIDKIMENTLQID